MNSRSKAPFAYMWITLTFWRHTLRMFTGVVCAKRLQHSLKCWTRQQAAEVPSCTQLTKSISLCVAEKLLNFCSSYSVTMGSFFGEVALIYYGFSPLQTVLQRAGSRGVRLVCPVAGYISQQSLPCVKVAFIFPVFNGLFLKREIKPQSLTAIF